MCKPDSSVSQMGPLFHLWYGNEPAQQSTILEDSPLQTIERKQARTQSVHSRISKPTAHTEPLQGYTIVLNPGHGGADAGAVYAGVEEKDLTFALAKDVRNDLVAAGARVVMTRTTDVDMELSDIDAVTKSMHPNAFLSIHFNANPNHNIRGATSYFWYQDSKPYAAKMLRSLVSEVPSLKSDGVLQNNYYVIDHTHVPATLVEVAYLSNSQDRSLITNSRLRKRIAHALADGEVAYLAHHENTPSAPAKRALCHK
jgi:N-acetylmuramoyl-L-alanine amidase